ncbi:MAG: hypothetical protein ACYDCC_11275 [Actinomycetota bacterium]
MPALWCGFQSQNAAPNKIKAPATYAIATPTFAPPELVAAATTA